jgi:hypothetical protein
LRCVVHYGGGWKGVVAPCPAVCVHGQDDPIPAMRRGTIAAALAYGAQVVTVRGSHRWNSANNPTLLAMAARAARPGAEN